MSSYDVTPHLAQAFIMIGQVLSRPFGTDNMDGDEDLAVPTLLIIARGVECLALYKTRYLFPEVGDRKPWTVHFVLGEGVDKEELAAATDAIQQCLDVRFREMKAGIDVTVDRDSDLCDSWGDDYLFC